MFAPRDPENRVRRAILRRLVVGELRRMIFKRFYAKLRDGVGHQKPLAPTNIAYEGENPNRGGIRVNGGYIK